MELFLIRHPEPAVAPGVCYGRSDLGLAGDAEAAAVRLRAHLPAAIAVYSSPLARCRALAERLAERPVFDERLVEMDFGEWEMQRWADIERATLDAWAADLLHFAPPGGESAAHLRARALHFLDDLGAAGHATAALVTHGGLLRVLCAHWLDLPPARWRELSFDFASVSRVVLDADGVRVAFLNRR